jgi:hypothetical protein
MVDNTARFFIAYSSDTRSKPTNLRHGFGGWS